MRKGEAMSESQKEKLRQARLGKKFGPEFRQKMKDLWKNEDYREHILSFHRGIKYSEESKAKMSKSIKKAMACPEIVAKAKKRQADPEWRKKIGERSKEAWSKPGAREKRAKKMAEVWSRPEIKKKVSGENSGVWRGGSSSQEYISGWPRIATSIRKRDDNLCQHPNCYKSSFNKRHHVHHIDFNKSNNDGENLITLCFGHHVATKFGDKDYWIEFYQEIQSQRGLGGFGGG